MVGVGDNSKHGIETANQSIVIGLIGLLLSFTSSPIRMRVCNNCPPLIHGKEDVEGYEENGKEDPNALLEDVHFPYDTGSF